MRNLFVHLCLFLSLLGSTLVAGESPVRYQASHNAMATEYTIVAYAKDRNYLAEVVEQVFEEVDRLDEQMSNYKPESELSGINRNSTTVRLSNSHIDVTVCNAAA